MHQRVCDRRVVSAQQPAEDEATRRVVVDPRNDRGGGEREAGSEPVGDRIEPDPVLRVPRKGVIEADVDHPRVGLQSGAGNHHRRVQISGIVLARKEIRRRGDACGQRDQIAKRGCIRDSHRTVEEQRDGVRGWIEMQILRGGRDREQRLRDRGDHR